MGHTGNILITGGTHTYLEGSSREFEQLAQRVATRARHDSGELSDPAKCHPDTRLAILTDLEEWAAGNTYNYPVKWISGSAGVGKTAIMRTIAEILTESGVLLADFFFWRTGERCNTADFLIATLSYQVAVSIPETRPYIEGAIRQDPHVFTRTPEAQSRALIVNPINSAFRQWNIIGGYPRIFIVDGLDECLDEKKQLQDADKQVEVLRVLQWTLDQLQAPFAVLVASRPEYQIQSTFDTLLKDSSSTIMLNDSYDAAADISRFYSAKFREIRDHHPLRSYLRADEWPSSDVMDELVDRASGQFIYASTVIKFVAASKKHPASQLKLILEADTRGNTKPLQALDQLYSTILSAVSEEDIPGTLRVLGALLVGRSRATPVFEDSQLALPPAFWDVFLRLGDGEVQRLTLGLESVVSLQGLRGDYFRFYHATLEEFLFDASRSERFFIDKEAVFKDLVKQCIYHLYSENDDIGDYIASGMEFWLLEAKPSKSLRISIEKARLPWNPVYLRTRFPILLQVIHRSEISLYPGLGLYKEKERAYWTKLSCVIRLYLSGGDALTFLLLAAVAIGAQDLQSGKINAVVDAVCPLSLQAIKMDRTEGFSLYEDLTSEASRRRIENMPTAYYSEFTDAVMSIIARTDDPGKLYACGSAHLVKYLSKSTSGASPGREVKRLACKILNFFLSKASADPILIECIENNTVVEPYLDSIKDDIDEYTLRTQSAVRGTHWLESQTYQSLTFGFVTALKNLLW